MTPSLAVIFSNVWRELASPRVRSSTAVAVLGLASAPARAHVVAAGTGEHFAYIRRGPARAYELRHDSHRTIDVLEKGLIATT